MSLSCLHAGKRAKREGMLLYDMFKEARILKRADEHICLVVTGPNLTAFLNHPDLQVHPTIKTLNPNHPHEALETYCRMFRV